MSREDHLKRCKQRANEYLENGDIQNALGSMFSDLSKHPETEGHPAIQIGMMLMVTGNLGTITEAKKFIDGFN
jgi:hypothetical protein